MKLRGPIQFKSVGMKLFIILFVTVVLMSAILGMSSYMMSKEIIRGQVGSASSQAIEQAADKLDIIFAEYESISRQMAVDQILKTDLETVVTKDIGIIKKTNAETRIKNKLDSMKGSDGRLLGIRLVNKDLSRIYASSGASGTQQDNKNVKARIQSIIDGAGKTVWIPGLQKGFFESFNEPTITMGRVLQNLKTPEAEYILLIEIRDKALINMLSNLKIGKAGEVRIITSDNTIVHSSDPSLIETKSFIGLKEEQIKSGETSFDVSDEKGVKQLVVFRQLQTVNWRLIGYAPESDFLSAADRLIYVTLFVLILAILVASAIGYYLFRMVGKPLQKLSRLMEEGERGNLKVRTNFKGKDEIGRLGQSFNNMLGQISLLVDRTNGSTQELLETAENLTKASRDTSLTAGEIAAATGEIAQGASSLAEEAEKGTELAEEIGTQMNRMVDLNDALDESASRVIQVSRQGRDYMEQLVDKTEAVSRMTTMIEENSGKLSRSTYSIRSILAPMIDMTKQTNILSLNASIEASRAGSAGKGFMVIAEEIRKLSAQSNDSIQNVSAMTEEIQAAIEDTVNVLSSVTPMFDEQLVSVREASSIFQNVSREMESFIGEIQASSSSVKELMVSQTSLRDFITSVSSVVQQTNASTEEVASMSTEQYKVSEELVRLSNRLEELSESLKKSLSVFQVEAAALQS
ncbi:methyl-accepting chemotaxis protein [Fontibacillus phaseoli]|uniref:Methyl-accepting chemotaxis protein n=1 Tax=Fontibacillus phaseoli TaxID=1416533 RepID=A0A369B9F6_9BACL|nr:methyl-accepting chemotaxis protein [Fontibacillus phaseoli]RCX18150.1 methyl-accepting chemotaxis protein [Fontibacillus phaseoli]